MTTSKMKVLPPTLADGIAVNLIDRIADRAVGLYPKFGVDIDRRDVQLDLTACHFSIVRLRLDELLSAPDVDFAHDIAGINEHLDRESFTLRDCFLPRYSARRVDRS